MQILYKIYLVSIHLKFDLTFIIDSVRKPSLLDLVIFFLNRKTIKSRSVVVTAKNKTV